MIINWSNDGKKYDKNVLLQGFEINQDKDIKKVRKVDKDNGEETEEYSLEYNFVGFLTNGDNDIFTVFPKHYRVDNLEYDSAIIFQLISTHIQKRPDIYLGKDYGEKFKTNYPFAAFFGIYDYYIKYGLYIDNKEYTKANIGGKVNWKETIKKTDFYLVNNQITVFPYYYNKKYYFNNFITECMIFAIDYTIEKFNAFINLANTGEKFPEHNFLEETNNIVNILSNYKQQVFRDNLIELIDNLINFYSNLNEGGTYYFKHYIFSSIWEDIVMIYLKDNFKEVKNDELIFDKDNCVKLNFQKKSFYPNLANKKHYISPDYYCTQGDTQFIFDAKYKNSVKGIDYKQIAYCLFLKELRENQTSHSKYSTTYSALILPYEKRESKIHFLMDPLFSKSNSDIKVIEEYLDIKEVIEYYLSV